VNSQIKPPIASSSLGDTEEEEEILEDEKDNLEISKLYMWYFESTDLGKLIIALRAAEHVRYTIRKIDEYNVEIVADGSLTEDEIKSMAKSLQVPDQMLRFRLKSWQQKASIHTDNQISGGPTVVATIGTLKIVTFPILAIKEDAVLVL
jgi:hypothetical protein